MLIFQRRRQNLLDRTVRHVDWDTLIQIDVIVTDKERVIKFFLNQIEKFF